MSSDQSKELIELAADSSANTFWSDASYGVGDRIGCAVHLRMGSDDPASTQLFKVLAYLGRGTSTDAELVGGIIGCLMVGLYAGSQVGAEKRTIWYSDCKTVVEKARQSTQRGGPWQAWLEASAAIQCEPIYVAPKQRSNDHTACDRASRWVRISGEKLLQKHGESPVGRLATSNPEVAWHLIDGRNFISSLYRFTTEDSCAEALMSLREQIGRVFAYRVSVEPLLKS